MQVLQYECPNCDYTKIHVTHRGCPNGAGRIVKIGGNWRCDACDENFGDEVGITCSSCGESVPQQYVTTADMQL